MAVELCQDILAMTERSRQLVLYPGRIGGFKLQLQDVQDGTSAGATVLCV